MFDKHSLRPALFFKTHLIDPIKPLYKAACKRWRSDTGGGAGQPENFLDWNPNHDYKFSYYTNGQSPALFTWIYMKDRELGYILENEKEDIPSSLQIAEESCDASTTSSLGFNSSGRV